MNALIIGLDFTTINNGGNAIRKRNYTQLSQIADSINFFPLSNECSVLRKFFSYLKGKHCGYTKSINKRFMNTIKTNSPDIIFIDGVIIKTFSIEKVKKLSPSTSIIVFFHNVESDFFRQIIQSKISFIRKIHYKYFLFPKIKKTESYYCSTADKLITLNNRDNQVLLKKYGRKADFIWPTSFPDSFLKEKYEYTDSQYLLFLGSDFFGNTEGLFWFIKNCMPYIQIPLKIVGHGMEKYSLEWNSSKIEFLGYVEDLAPVITDSIAIVLPIISGSGMKTKTCECLMYGKKIFGTTEAFEGYDNITNSGCVCCNSADAFISQINTFLNTINQTKSNAYSYKYLPEVRQYFLNNYEQTIQQKKFSNFLEKGIKTNKPSAVFCILARDCEKNINNNIKIIENYRSQFSKSTVIIIENDSIDSTKNILENWKNNTKEIVLKSQNHPEWKNLNRVERIANCRNEYMNELRNLNDEYDYVIVLDMDVELQNVNLLNIINKAPKDFSALTANGRYYVELFGKKIPVKYYDLYAYVPYKSQIIEYKQSELMKNGDKLEKDIRKTNFLLCDSAFGGLAIYKYAAIKQLCYKLIKNTRSTFFSTICEHVLFNKSCMNSGNIYIAKDLKLMYEKLSIKFFIITIIRFIFKSKITNKLIHIYLRLFRRKTYDPKKD